MTDEQTYDAVVLNLHGREFDAPEGEPCITGVVVRWPSNGGIPDVGEVMDWLKEHGHMPVRMVDGDPDAGVCQVLARLGSDTGYPLSEDEDE